MGDLGRFVLLFCPLLGALGPNFAIFIDFLSISGASRDAPTLENHRFSLVKRRFFRKLDFSSGAAVGLAFCLPGRALGTLLGSSWPLLGCSWALLGPSWGALGELWGRSWGALGGSWALLAAHGAHACTCARACAHPSARFARPPCRTGAHFPRVSEALAHVHVHTDAFACTYACACTDGACTSAFACTYALCARMRAPPRRRD